MTKYRSKGTLEAIQFNKFGDYSYVREVRHYNGPITYELWYDNDYISEVNIGDYIIVDDDSLHVMDKATFEERYEQYDQYE